MALTDRNAAGHLAAFFVDSKLTPLFLVAVAVLGVVALLVTPREEDPQILVPGARVEVGLPGASAAEVEQLLLTPLEGILSEMQGVRHIQGVAMNSRAVVSVEFKVGVHNEDALVRVYHKVDQNRQRLPADATPARISLVDVDDVPIVGITLTSATVADDALRRAAIRMADHLRSLPGVSIVEVLGGSDWQVRVAFDPERMQAFGITLNQGLSALRATNRAGRVGEVVRDGQRQVVFVDSMLRDVDAVNALPLASHEGRLIYLSDVADVSEGPPLDRRRITRFNFGPASANSLPLPPGQSAVTITVAKLRNSNAVTVADTVLDRVHRMQKRFLPAEVQVQVLRDDGKRADAAVNGLVGDLGIAIAAVLVVLVIFLGSREALIVTALVPLTMVLVLVADFAMGISINRVTLFGLIVALGSLVDAGIVVVENIHRHFRERPDGDRYKLAVEATNEIGNPTNFATFAIMAVFASLVLLTDVQGEYFWPITFNVPVAMFASLIVAYIVTPWAAARWLRADAAGGWLLPALAGPRLQRVRREMGARLRARLPEGPLAQFSLAQLGDYAAARTGVRSWPGALYDRLLCLLLDRPGARFAFYLLLVLLIASALAQPLWQFVRPQGVAGALSAGGVGVTFLPKSDRNSFNITIDLPETAPVQETDRLARRIGRLLDRNPEVVNYLTTIGEPGMVDRAGLMRGNLERHGPWQGEIRVNLRDKRQRDITSIDLVRQLREQIEVLQRDFPGSDVRLVEEPPGPPQPAMLLAEIYGPDLTVLRSLTAQVTQIFASEPGLVEVHNSLQQPPLRHRLVVDNEAARLAGVTAQQIEQVLRALFGRVPVDRVHGSAERSVVPIVMQVPPALELDPDELDRAYVVNADGKRIPLGNLVTLVTDRDDTVIRHKDNERVEFVGAEVVNSSPIYAVISLNKRLKALHLDRGRQVRTGNLGLFEEPPDTIDGYQILWQGESRLMLNSFREMGLSLLIAVLMVMLLLVGYYGSFSVPVIAIVSLPLALIGVFPGHWLMNAYFSGPSIIGIIALAGVGVRGALLIVDFVRAQQGEGIAARDAVRIAGRVRLRPIFLTAGTVVLGSVIMIGDPVFGGLAISLIFGITASTLFTIFLVPLLYYQILRRQPAN